MRFFDPTGKDITLDQFVDFYNKCYYLNNSRIVEEVIEAFLNADCLSPENVMLILEWKLGRIDHKESQFTEKPICRKRNPNNIFLTSTRRGEINAEDVCRYISNDFKNLKGTEDAQIILNDIIKDHNTDNIGTVYLITLLYFISAGEYPIYDRFAMMALDAIDGNKKPGSAIKYRALPAKSENKFSLLMSEDEKQSEYRRYINLLTNISEKHYTMDKKNRDIDRALWVYGHLFKQL